MLKEISVKDEKKLRAWLDERSQEINPEVVGKAAEILNRVRKEGDAALIDYTQRFDGVSIQNFRVSEEELDEAEAKCDASFKEAMRLAAQNIETFHKAQLPQSYLVQKDRGIYLGERVIPLSSVGIYVPGGRAQYPSSVLMNAIPAKVAGVQRIVMVTPPNKEGTINGNQRKACSCN